MHPLRSPAAAVLVAVALGGCAGMGGSEADPFAPRDAAPTVRVTNNNWSDMNVYAVRFGERRRLGTVTSMTTRVLRLPPTLVQGGRGFELMVDPIGGRQTYRTGSLFVSAGQQVDFTIENHLAISSYMIRSR